MRHLGLLAPAGIVGLAVVARLAYAAQLPANPLASSPLLAQPFHRAPLLDLVTLLAPERRALVAVALGALTVVLTGALARRGLGERAGWAVMLGVALAPPLLLLGAWWAPAALVAPLAVAVALLLHRALAEGPRGAGALGTGARGLVVLGLAAALLASADWAGLAPVVAWLAWLLAFRPESIPAPRARRAAWALGAGLLGALGVDMLLLAGGADPQAAWHLDAQPVGLEALRSHLASAASLVLGRGGGRLPLAAQVLVVLGTLWLAARGARAVRPYDPAWAGVLAVGAGGSLLAALFIHPSVPVAVDKALWYTTPMLLCLFVAGVRRVRWAGTPLLLLLGLTATLPACDADGDGVLDPSDCDDDLATTFPGALDVWGDGLDNDCDGAVDASNGYREIAESEPNDRALSACFAPGGQEVGDLAAFGQLNRLTGRIATVLQESYEGGDPDCFALRFPDDAGHPRLEVRLRWDDVDSDLDFAVQGLWEGRQAGFALADASGPGPEFAVTSAGFDGGSTLWLWVIGYTGPPTDYSLELVLRD